MLKPAPGVSEIAASWFRDIARTQINPKGRCGPAALAGGAANHITVTRRLFRRYRNRLCQRKIVSRNEMMPPGTTRRLPRCRESAAGAPGVAICSAAIR